MYDYLSLAAMAEADPQTAQKLVSEAGFSNSKTMSLVALCRAAIAREKAARQARVETQPKVSC